MTRTWKKVDRLEAETHPLYGIKNWLAVFAFGMILSAARPLSAINMEAKSAGMTLGELLGLDNPLVTPLKILLAGYTSAAVLPLLFLFTKHPKFRLVASLALALTFPIALSYVALLPNSEAYLSAAVVDFFPWAVSTVVWVTYLQRSKRVRVTFEHMVLSREAIVRQPFEPAKAAALSATGNAPRKPARSEARHLQRHEGAATEALIPAIAFEIDEDSWTKAFAEVEGPDRRPGLWARSYSEAQGNEALAKAKYLEYRASEIAHGNHAARAQHEVVPSGIESSAPHQGDSSFTKLDLMAHFGIVADGKQFVWGEHRYDRLADAIAYAALKEKADSRSAFVKFASG